MSSILRKGGGDQRQGGGDQLKKIQEELSAKPFQQNRIFDDEGELSEMDMRLLMMRVIPEMSNFF